MARRLHRWTNHPSKKTTKTHQYTKCNLKIYITTHNTQKINIVDKSLIPVRIKTSTPKNKQKTNSKTTPKDTINTTQKTAFNRHTTTTENTDSIENEVAVKNLLLSSTEEDTNTHIHTVHLQVTEANKLMDTLLQTNIQTETQHHIDMEIDQEHEWEIVKENNNKQKDKDKTPPPLNEDKPPPAPTNADPDRANNTPQIIRQYNKHTNTSRPGQSKQHTTNHQTI